MHQYAVVILRVHILQYTVITSGRGSLLFSRKRREHHTFLSGAQGYQRRTVVKIGAWLTKRQSPFVFVYTKLVEKQLCLVRHIRLEKDACQAQSFGGEIHSTIDILSRLSGAKVECVGPRFGHVEECVRLKRY